MSRIAKRTKAKGNLITLSAVIGLLAGGLAACAPQPAQPADPDTLAPRPTAAATATETGTMAATEPAPETAPTPTLTQTPTSASETLDHRALLDDLLYGQVSREEAGVILDQIGASGDTRFVGGLIDTLRYQRALTPDVGAALNELTGQDMAADWFEWVEWAGKHPEIESFADAPASTDTTGLILDEAGVSWQVTEAALISENGDELSRLPGHMAYWFGWYQFFPQTLIYGEPR